MGAWGGGNAFFRAFHKRAAELGHTLINPQALVGGPDVIVIAGLDNDGADVSAEQAIMYKMMMSSTSKKDIKLLLRVNENDARKNTTHVDDYLLKLSQHVDHTVFVSNWIRDYFIERGWSGQHSVIINGVDRDVFCPQEKLNNNKLNIVTHHWSDNALKGADIYEKLDELVGLDPDKFAFTYIGRHRCSFKHTTVVKPLFAKRLAEELGKHDVYVSASRHDPGPNHIIESISCGLPTWVIKTGGGSVEFAGEDHMYSDWDELKTLLASERINDVNDSAVRFTDWNTCVDGYLNTLERML